MTYWSYFTALLKYKTSVEESIAEISQVADNVQVDQVVQELPDPFEETFEPQTSHDDNGTKLRRFTRTKIFTIPNDYEVYLQEQDHMIWVKTDPELFHMPWVVKCENYGTMPWGKI